MKQCFQCEFISYGCCIKATQIYSLTCLGIKSQSLQAKNQGFDRPNSCWRFLGRAHFLPLPASLATSLLSPLPSIALFLPDFSTVPLRRTFVITFMPGSSPNPQHFNLILYHVRIHPQVPSSRDQENIPLVRLGVAIFSLPQSLLLKI